MYILSKFEKSSEIKFAFKITIGIILANYEDRICKGFYKRPKSKGDVY